jgi:hypothetical protein
VFRSDSRLTRPCRGEGEYQRQWHDIRRKAEFDGEVCVADGFGVVLAISQGKVVIPDGSPGAGEHQLRQLRVLVFQDGRWLVRAETSTPIVSSPVE